MSANDPRAVLVEELGRIAPDVDVATIDENADLREEFDIDSMDFLNLVTALAKRFAIPIPEADYPRLGSFAKAVAYLGAKAVAA
jgi:acyl carrier protein